MIISMCALIAIIIGFAMVVIIVTTNFDPNTKKVLSVISGIFYAVASVLYFSDGAIASGIIEGVVSAWQLIGYPMALKEVDK